MREDEEELEETTIAEELIKRAQENRHSDFELLTNLGAYRAAKTYQSALRKVYNNFCRIERDLYNDYVKGVKQGAADVLMLVSLKELYDITSFYGKEYDLVEDMLQEFKVYLGAGHLLDALFGERSEEDMYDYRVGPPSDGRE